MMATVHIQPKSVHKWSAEQHPSPGPDPEAWQGEGLGGEKKDCFHGAVRWKARVRRPSGRRAPGPARGAADKDDELDPDLAWHEHKASFPVGNLRLTLVFKKKLRSICYINFLNTYIKY